MAKQDLIGEVDLDKSSIEIDSEWMTSKQLKSTIKDKIESGDYDVTMYANALKKLEKTLSSIEEVQLRMPMNVLKAYKNMAEDKDMSVESCLRKGVEEYLRSQDRLPSSDDDEERETKSGKKKSKKR